MRPTLLPTVIRALVSTTALAALAASGAAFAQAYRWVDENGRVQYSDKPPPEKAKEERVIKAPPPAPAPPRASPTEAKKQPGAPGKAEQRGYAALRILTPASEETISNTDVVAVQLALEPALDNENGHKIRILLDGAPAGLWDAPQGSVTDVIRGAHTLRAEVIDRSGATVASTETVTFYVQQASALSPGRKK